MSIRLKMDTYNFFYKDNQMDDMPQFVFRQIEKEDCSYIQILNPRVIFHVYPPL